MKPKISLRNIFNDIGFLKSFAQNNGFDGIDWSFELDNIPSRPAEVSAWVKDMALLGPMEVRYHCPFYRIDLGHDDPDEARNAEAIFQRVIHLVSKAGGRYLTIHIGLGHNSTEPLSWDDTIDNLRKIVQFGGERGVKVCLENLAWGWTSRPNLFEKLVRRSGAAITFDIGHAESCESIMTQQYAIEDFITPHSDRVLNAHVYHKEIEGVGHIPPESVDDIEESLSLLERVGCDWWVIEINEKDGLLKTKNIVDEFLAQKEIK